jgi:hypothetical protein
MQEKFSYCFGRNRQMFPRLSRAEAGLSLAIKTIVLPRLDNGKPRETVEHKATGLKPNEMGYGSRVATRAQCLIRSVISWQP